MLLNEDPFYSSYFLPLAMLKTVPFKAPVSLVALMSGRISILSIFLS
jgi:hypothetical protein